jgi:DNA invertase Pin-like site-specific DNA recombinase
MAANELEIGDDGRVRLRRPALPGTPRPGEPRYALLYLRLSEMTDPEQMAGRIEALRALATGLGFIVPADGVRIENDMDGDKPKNASAFKRKRITITLEDGTTMVVWRVIRPVFAGIIADLQAGRAHAMFAEDIDRIARDPRDLEDLIDVSEHHGAVIHSKTAGQVNLATNDGITMARVMLAFANMSSRATARRVAEGHDRYFGKSYRGGQCGYGFSPDPESAEYRRRLVHHPEQAEVIRAAYDDLLDRRVKLREVLAGLRERGVPTMRGGQWTQTTLKSVLIKPAVAGLDNHNGDLRPGPWEPIVSVERWTQMVTLLCAPERRRRGPSPTPSKYMLSLIAVCGVCGAQATGSKMGPKAKRGPRYMCQGGWHVTRSVDRLDQLVGAVAVGRLSMPDAADLLKPPPPLAATEAARWEAQTARLRRLIREKNTLHTEGLIDGDQARADLTRLRGELAEAEAALRAPAGPDPLAEFRGRPAAAVWASMGTARRRAVLQALMERVVIHPVPDRGRRVFNPELIEIVWRDETRPPAEVVGAVV